MLTWVLWWCISTCTKLILISTYSNSGSWQHNSTATGWAWIMSIALGHKWNYSQNTINQRNKKAAQSSLYLSQKKIGSYNDYCIGSKVKSPLNMHASNSFKRSQWRMLSHSGQGLPWTAFRHQTVRITEALMLGKTLLILEFCMQQTVLQTQIKGICTSDVKRSSEEEEN